MNVASFLQIFAAVAWLAFVGMIVIVVLRASRNKSVKPFVTILVIALVAAVLISSVSAGLVFIQPEERGVVISALQAGGYRPEPLQPGLRWIIPYFESVVTYPISRQTYTMSIATSEGDIQGDDSITARTSDGQEIFVDASVIYAIDPTKVVNVHIDWQDRYTDELVRPLARGVIRDVVSQYRVEQVVTTKRTEMTDTMSSDLAQRLSENGLTLVSFILRNITFSPEYAASVEQKQIAEQQAQQAAFVVDQRKQEAEQARQVAQGQADATVINAKGDAEARVVQAEAEAKANQLLADSIRGNPELISYLYVQKLSAGVQTIFVPSGNQFILPLPDTTAQPTQIEPTVSP